MSFSNKVAQNAEVLRESFLSNASRVCSRRRPITIFQVFLLLAALMQPKGATATITTLAGSTTESYPALPAQFGAEWKPGVSDSEAVLRYLPDNPLLCHPIHDDMESYALSQSLENQTPLVYLAKRGSCPYYEKAANVVSFSPQIQYLIIFHDEAFEPDAIISMSAPKENSPKSLHILSTSYNTGNALLQYMNSSLARKEDTLVLLQITKQEVAEAALMKTKPVKLPTNQESTVGDENDDEWEILMPFGSSNMDRDLLNPTLGMFFTVLLLSSTFLLCLVAANPSRRRHLRLPLGDQSTYVLNTVESCFVGHNLLTNGEIQRYLVVKDDDVEEGQELRGDSTTACDCNGKVPIECGQPDTPSIQCAICIDDVLESEGTIRLPCNHSFHKDCILPWLTERNGTCPLCKYDVHQFVQESAALDFSLPKNYIVGIRKKLRAFFRLAPTSQSPSVDSEESIDIEGLEMNDSTLSSSSIDE